MDTSRDISTTELLLQVMELTSLGALSRSQISKHLRRAHPLARLDRRLDGALDVLAGEELIELDEESGQTVYRTTHAGLTTLEENGRYATDATVLFTDIVGSTELIDSAGEAEAHEIRQRHFALLRDVIADHGGREVKNLGDGLMVVFSKAPSAIACATAMQRRVADDPDQVGLRVGLHAGELLRDGNDFFGSTVIIARRLCDRAESGQTIASTSTCELAEEEFEGAFKPLGLLLLKGLSTPVESSSVGSRSATESLAV